jgi:hypothetical protein
MKKTWIICLFAAVLTVSGCGKKEETAETEQETAMVSIAETDFTQAAAEALLKQEVSSHCGSTLACKVTSVKISGKNITGTYTYEEDGKTMDATVTLSNVEINKNNPDIYTVGTKEFSASAKETASESSSQNSSADNKTEDKTDGRTSGSGDKKTGGKLPDDMPALNLPAKKLDPEKTEDTEFAAVKEEGDTYVYRIYLFQKGTLHVTGNYGGGGTFRTVILNEDQSLAKDLINITEEEELKYDVQLDAGFYYIYFKINGGTWNAEFNTTY